jgi:hypothetical protein
MTASERIRVARSAEHDCGVDSAIAWSGTEAIGRLCHVCGHVRPLSARDRARSASAVRATCERQDWRTA